MFGSKINPSGAASDFGDEISNSILFARADDPGITRTHSTTADSDKKVTISWWQKFTAEGNADSGLYVCFSSAKSVGNSAMDLYFNAGYAEWYFLNSGTIDGILRTNREFRDPIGWTNFVLSIDTTISSPASARMRMWINGIEETSLTSSSGSPQYPAQNDLVNVLADGTKLVIGEDDGGGYNFDGYLADFIMLDGIAVTDATNFGRFSDSHSSVWVPINYSGSYGTNGFRLDFSVAPGTGNGAGTDVSGNGRHFTDSNLGASDQVNDTPTKVYATWNPLYPPTMGHSGTATLTEGMRRLSSSSGNYSVTLSTLAIPAGSGKYAAKFTVNTLGGIYPVIGVYDIEGSNAFVNAFPDASDSVGLRMDGQKYVDGSSSSYGSAVSAGNTVEVELDLDNNTVEFLINGSAQGTISKTFTGSVVFMVQDGSNSSAVDVTAEFDYTPNDSNFLTLNSLNLPEATVDKPGDFFQATKYTGNGTAIGSGGLTVSNGSFSPALVWIKNRDAADDHAWYDTQRGVTKQIESNTQTIESTEAEGLTAFTSTGFTLGNLDQVNTNTEDFIAWQWAAGTAFSGDGSGGAAGTVASSGVVAAPGHFSIFKFVANSGSAYTAKHGLSAAPEFFVVKHSGTSGSAWVAYAKHAVSDAHTDYLLLDGNGALQDDATVWNDTAPDANVISIGTNSTINNGTADMIGYAWRSVPGVCKVGSYIGNGSATAGPYVALGFRPRWIMVKNASVARDWVVVDTARTATNPAELFLFPNEPNSEAANGPASGSTYDFDLLADGFRPLTGDSAPNGSGNTILYVAMAEAAIGSNAPFPNAR
jgi:hypothetical protein